LIADGGNRRLIEVVDRYSYDITNQRIGAVINVNGEPQTGVLLWHSPPNVSGKDFEYNSVSRIWVPTSPTTGRYVFVAGVGAGLPTRVDTGLDPSSGGVELRESRTGNGGIVIFDPANPSGNLVINQLNLPGVNANVTWNDTTGSFNSPAVAPSTKLLSNVSSVTAKVVMIGSSPMIAIMVTDATGVYEALYDPSAPTVDNLNVDWVLPASAYRALRRNGAGVPIGENMPLRATFARRLDNGDILVINGYYGKRRDGKVVGGEILQLDGTPNATATISSLNYGFGVLSILFELPPLDSSRGLVIPVFADRK
jgi:hypothetical protein